MSTTQRVPFPTDLNAPGALEQLLEAHRGVFGDTRMEQNANGNAGDNGAGDDGTGNGAGQQSGGSENGGQSLQDVVDQLGLTPEQIAGRLEASAKWERRAKSNDRVDRKDYERVVKELGELKQANESASEKAIREAREAGASEARQQTSAATAEAVLRIALRNANKDISDDDLEEAVSLTNLSALVTEDGGIDEKKVLVAVGRHAGTASGSNNAGPDMGQGNRGSHRTTPGEGGNAEADRRFGKNA